MARNIFEITSEIAVAKTDLFASEEEIEKRLEILMNELIHKEDAVLALYESFQQDIDLADKYIDKIKKQKTIRQNSQKSMKNMIIDCYQLTEKLPKHSEFNPIKIMESMSVDIINEKNIPEEYWKETYNQQSANLIHQMMYGENKYEVEDYEYGLYPPDQAYPGGGRTTYAGGVNPLDRKLNAGNVGGSPTMGGNLASIDALGNRGYNVDNQGTIMPNITVEFTGDEEEESGKINPAWNKGRLGLYN